MARDQISSNADKVRQDNDTPEHTPPALRVLKLAVLLMAFVLLAGFAFLVYTLVMRSQAYEPGLASVETVVRLVVKPGETVQSVSLDGTLLALHVRSTDGKQSVVIYNLKTDSVLRRLDIVAE